MSDFEEYQREMLADVARVMGVPYSLFVVQQRENVFEDMVAECQRITGRRYRVSSAGMRRLLTIAMTRPVSISVIFSEWRYRFRHCRWGKYARHADIFMPKPR